MGALGFLKVVGEVVEAVLFLVTRVLQNGDDAVQRADGFGKALPAFLIQGRFLLADDIIPYLAGRFKGKPAPLAGRKNAYKAGDAIKFASDILITYIYNGDRPLTSAYAGHESASDWADISNRAICEAMNGLACGVCGVAMLVRLTLKRCLRFVLRIAILQYVT